MKIKWWQIALGISIVLALLSPLASGSPDGLEKVAEDHGFLGMAQGTPFQLIADYVFPGIHNEALATILAGIVGTAVLFGLVYGLGKLVLRRPAKTG
jgi:cobalt/nickel transport protein